MAKSYVQYYGTGAQTQFPVTFGYNSKSDVQAKVNGSVVSFTWINASVVSISPAPALGALVDMRRVTPSDAPSVDFQDGAVVTEDQLDTNAKQALFVAQEVADNAADDLQKTVHAPSSETGVNLQLPAAATRANKLVGFASDGKTVSLVDPLSVVKGDKGDPGQSFVPNVVGLAAGKSAYNAQTAGFSYLATDTALLYFKLSNTSGDWSSGISFGKGDKGDTGSTGPAGQGVPADGGVDDVLKKNSSTPYDASWGKIGTNNISDGAVTNAKLAGSIAFSKLASDAGNAKGARTVSTSPASGGGTDGDIWYQV